MTKLSAGILLYDLVDGELKLLLVHPGGPFWAKKDLGAWSIPKGEYEEGEDACTAALREFEEETGAQVAAAATGELIALDSVKQRNGKTVTAWAAAGGFDTARLVSNTFQMEWPKGTGMREFPEVDRAAWFGPEETRAKLVAAQAPFVDRLIAKLREGGQPVNDPQPGPDPNSNPGPEPDPAPRT